MHKVKLQMLTMLLLAPWITCTSPVWAEATSGLTEQQEIEQQIERIEDKMKTEPKLEGWLLLGGAYMHLKRFDEAVRVYQNAYLISNYDKEVRSKLEFALYKAGLAKKDD